MNQGAERIKGVVTPSGVESIVRGCSYHTRCLLDLLCLARIQILTSRLPRDIFCEGKPLGLPGVLDSGMALLVFLASRHSQCKLALELL